MSCNFMSPLIQKDMESGWFILNVGPYTGLASLVIHFSISKKYIKHKIHFFVKCSPLSRLKSNRKKQFWEMTVKKGIFKNSAKFTGRYLPFLDKVADCSYYKRDSGTGVFLWVLWNFQEHLKWISSANRLWTD